MLSCSGVLVWRVFALKRRNTKISSFPLMQSAQGTFIETWERLDALLWQHREFWQFRPFEHLELPWKSRFPELCAWLESLSQEEIDLLDPQPARLSEALAPCLPEAPALEALTPLPQFPKNARIIDERINYRMPERKWRQIRAFAASVPLNGRPLLEWCSGMGHLGRLLARMQEAPLECLEKSAELCEKGSALARRNGVRLVFHPFDVLSPEVSRYLKPGQHVLALHACGDLHRKLLQEAARIPLAALSLAPCCYHATSAEFYRPLSSPGQRSPLQLTRFDLQLPLQETVVANRRAIRLRRREIGWRLGFDLLQRDVRGVNRYLNVPSARESLLGGDFPGFCRWAAAKRNVSLPHRVDFEFYEGRGEERRIAISRMELLRHLFRRPLEIWLLLDYAMFLGERGYRVQVGEFCEKSLTPRNVLLHAEREGD